MAASRVRALPAGVDLAASARRSADGESFSSVGKGHGYRIGTGARASPDGVVYFVEVALNPFADRPTVDLANLDRTVRLAVYLEARGYDLRCEEEGTITAERALAPERLAQECDVVRRRLRGGRGAR